MAATRCLKRAPSREAIDHIWSHGPTRSVAACDTRALQTQQVVLLNQKIYFSANCNRRMSKAGPRTNPAAVTMSQICPKFGAGFGLLPPQFMFGLASAGWFGMLNVSKRS